MTYYLYIDKSFICKLTLTEKKKRYVQTVDMFILLAQSELIIQNKSDMTNRITLRIHWFRKLRYNLPKR